MERQMAAAAVASPASPVAAVIVYDENEARSRRTRLLAFACCCLSVGLVAVGLLSPFWLEAEGFHQGLWRYCTWTTATSASSSSSSTSSDAAPTCFDNVDSAWMFVCRLLCCLTFVLNLLIVFVLATKVLPRGRPSTPPPSPPSPPSPSSGVEATTSGCGGGARLSNAVIVCLLAASIIMMSVVVVLFPAMFLREKDVYRLRFNRSQWFFSWTYGITCGAIPFLLTSAAIITYDSLVSTSASAAALASHQATTLKPAPPSHPPAYKEANRQFHCPA